MGELWWWIQKLQWLLLIPFVGTWWGGPIATSHPELPARDLLQFQLWTHLWRRTWHGLPEPPRGQFYELGTHLQPEWLHVFSRVSDCHLPYFITFFNMCLICFLHFLTVTCIRVIRVFPLLSRDFCCFRFPKPEVLEHPLPRSQSTNMHEPRSPSQSMRSLSWLRGSLCSPWRRALQANWRSARTTWMEISMSFSERH